jgi:cell wall-associated NlpC family hydrolase
MLATAALAVVCVMFLAMPRARAATWSRESDRVLAAARQHLGQYPYGYADGGSKSSITPQLMSAAAPYLASGVTAGMDCVGFVYVVFAETGHGGSAAAANRVVDRRRDVPSMYSLYKSGYGRTTFDGALENKPTSKVNDTYAKPGDILIFKNDDGAAPSSSNLAHVAIYSGSGRMINMTSTAVLEISVGSILGDGGVPYVMAAVVHTGLYANADGSPVSPLAGVLPAAPVTETQAIFDVTGYFSDDSSGATYHPAAMNADGRVLDSRSLIGVNGHFVARTPKRFCVAGYGNVPYYAVAVTGNVTVTRSTEGGYVTVAPGGTLQAGVAPVTSTINFPKGEDRANSVSVALSSDGCLDAIYWASSGKTTDIIFDVTGYYTDDATGASYWARGSTSGGRVLDSRSGIGVGGSFAARQPQTFRVAAYPGDPYGPSDVRRPRVT